MSMRALSSGEIFHTIGDSAEAMNIEAADELLGKSQKGVKVGE
jgi:hypothetical protein